MSDLPADVMAERVRCEAIVRAQAKRALDIGATKDEFGKDVAASIAELLGVVADTIRGSK